MGAGDSDFGLQVSIGFLGRVTTVVVGFVGSVFLARVLGPSGYGAFYFITAIVGVIDNPITGWATACKKRFAEADCPNEEVVGSLLIGLLLSLFPFVGAVYFAAPLVRQYVDIDNLWILMSVFFFGAVSFRSVLELLESTDKFGWGSWLVMSRDTLRVLLQVGLVIAGLGVTGMILGMSVASLAIVPVILYMVGVRPTVPSRQSVRSIWKFGKSSIPLGFLGTAKGKMDIILLGTLAGQAATGNYEVALKMTLPGMLLAQVVSQGLVGRISARHSRDKEFVNDIRNSLSYASLFSLPLFFGVVIIGDAVVAAIYGSDYTQAGMFIAWLALYRVVASQSRILSSSIQGIDRPDIDLRISLLSFVLNVVLGVSLYFTIGALGIVIATVISAILEYSLFVRALQRKTESINCFPTPLIHQALSGVLMAVVLLMLRRVVPLSRSISVVLLIIVGGIVYFSILSIISESFRNTALAILRDINV